MGGAIRVIIRKPGGEVCSQVRWTNPLPGRILNFDFLNGSADEIDGYIKDAPPDEADDKDIAPVEYGLVFVDFVDRKIVSMQGYSQLDRIYGVTLLIGLNGQIVADDDRYLPQSQLLAFWKHDNDMLSLVNWKNSEKVPGIDFEKMLTQRPDKKIQEILMDAVINVDLSKIGWSYLALEEGKVSEPAWREILTVAGIVPTEKAWKEFFEEKYE